MPAKSHHKTHEKTKWLQPDTSKLVKWSPSDADDAGHGGQHHQHHWGPVSQIARLPVPPPTSKNWCSGPDGPRRLVFKTVCAHDAHFEGSGKPHKMLHKSLRAAGIRFQNPCQFWSDLGRGSGRAHWRNGGPMMQGRRHWRPKPGPRPAAATRGRCPIW